MFDAAQPWLPLLEEEARPDPPLRRSQRRRAAPALVSSGAREHRAARLAFLGLVSSWALTATEALTLLGEPLSSEAERLERIDGVLGARRSLQLIAPDLGRAAEILRQPDPALEGASLLGIMLRDGLPGIARARAHIMAQLTR